MGAAVPFLVTVAVCSLALFAYCVTYKETPPFETKDEIDDEAP